MEPRVILVTGCGQGIGREVVRLFSEKEPCHLICLDKRDDLLMQMREEFSHIVDRIQTHAVDVSDLPHLRVTLQTALSGLNKVDVLVNNAGICDENDLSDIDIWQKVINVNLHGTFNVTHLVRPHMERGGRIINISSVLGRGGKVRNTAYCASKHGILGFAKGLAMDLAAEGITVNCILPAWVETPMLHQELEAQAKIIGSDPQLVIRNARKKIPTRRFVAAREVAEVAYFIASAAASSVTAQSFVIDGGSTFGL